MHTRRNKGEEDEPGLLLPLSLKTPPWFKLLLLLRCETVIIDDHDRGEEEHGTIEETLFAAATDVAGTGALQAIPSGNMAMVVQDRDRWRERP
jgi:hypothetical protein